MTTQRVGLGDVFSLEIPTAWTPRAESPDDTPKLLFDTGRDAYLAATPYPPLPGTDLSICELLVDLTDGGNAGRVLHQQPLSLAGLDGSRLKRALEPSGAVHSALVTSSEATVLLTLVCGPEDSAYLVPAFDRMLGSLEIGASKAAELAMDVAQRIRDREPDLLVEIPEVRTLLVRDPKNSSRVLQIGLSSLAAQIDREPGRRAELIDERIVALRVNLAQDAPAAVTASSIYPRLVPRERLDSAFAQAPEGYIGPVTRAFPHDATLYEALAAETPTGFRYLNPSDLADLDMSWDEAMRQACENLTAFLSETPPTVFSGPDGRPALVVFENPHAAACLMLPSFSRIVGSHLGDGFLCCAPAQDELVAVRNSDAEVADDVLKKAQASFERDPYPVSKQVFEAGRKGLRPRSKSWWKFW